MLLLFGLNVCFVRALSPNFDFDSCAFFCLALVPALCKTFCFSPSLLKTKTKTNGVPHGPGMARHVAHKMTKFYN